ncbi:hypothetical protein Mapa_005087 [Marchantia paleacea]|nr:hypothetical protein Mapa_005087 [Marchantia paleacea]
MEFLLQELQIFCLPARRWRIRVIEACEIIIRQTSGSICYTRESYKSRTSFCFSDLLLIKPRR